MKQIIVSCTVIGLAFLSTGCDSATSEKTTAAEPAVVKSATTTDAQSLKAEIQELETAWSAADNARDVNAMAAFYSDDAVSMPNNQPMLVGKDAIKKEIEASMAKRAKGSTISFDVMDVYGSGNYATEVGKSTQKDSTGKVIGTGKYMVVWEKRDGKWVTIRDIYNDDAKQN